MISKSDSTQLHERIHKKCYDFYLNLEILPLLRRGVHTCCALSR